MKKEKLKDYILHLEKWIPEKTLKKTLKEIKTKQWIPHTHLNSVTLKTVIKKNELDRMLPDNFLACKKEIHDLIWKALEKYILKKFKNKYHKGWSGFSGVNFNRYRNNQLMTKHCDHIKSLFEGERRGIPVLSMIGALNDNYQGGEFIMFDDYEIKLKKGDFLLFPSVFLYPHLVKPVTKGTRYTFVSWSW